METKNISLHEIAELLLPLLLCCLSRETEKKSRESDAEHHRIAIAGLAGWLGSAVPESVLNDRSLDFVELLYYCFDLARKLFPKDLAAILGLETSEFKLPQPPPQMLLHLLHIQVPSDSVYHQVRTAVATKAFRRIDGTPFPTTEVKATDVRGHAQLKPLVLDTTAMKPEEEEDLAKLMWEQHGELSDLDSDVWDYCNWKWLQGAQCPEDYVTVTVQELLTMRGIAKKINGKGQRGGYKRTQKEVIVRSIEHLKNVSLKLFEFEVYRRRRGRSSQSLPEPIQDRAIRIREGGQLDIEGGLQLRSIEFRPGTLFSRFLFGPGKQVALLAARALEYDLKSQSYEKRLARYLSWQWRIRASRLDYLQPYRVRTLLGAIALKAESRFPGRTRDRLETGLDRLQSDGVIGTWQYDHDHAEQNKAGWMSNWLVSTILVEPPQIIFETYRNIGQRRDELVDTAEFADQLKEKRLHNGLTIVRAAEQSGVPPHDYLLAENGRRLPGSVLNKLEKWLHGPLAS